MKATWLHISDFHVKTGDPYDRNVVLRALVEHVRTERERGRRRPDVIFATGDVAFSGKPAEYAAATPFFEALLKAAELDRSRLFVIPGNHDVDRTQGIGLARTLGSRDEADAYFGPDVPKMHLVNKLRAFREWHDGFFDGVRAMPGDSTCGPVEVLAVDGGRLGILPINTALFCLDDEDHAKLWVGRRLLDEALAELRDGGADLRIALLHHPLEWLADAERANVKAKLHGNVDVLLRGHLHENDVESIRAIGGEALHLAAGAAYQTRRWPNRALWVTVDGPGLTVFPVRYEDQPREVWTVDPSLFPDDEGYARHFTISRLEPASNAATPVRHAPPSRPAAATPRFRSNVSSRHELPFEGRDAEFGEIEAQLADPAQERVLVLHGQPGVGKSELAREYARKNRERYPGGTFVIDAGGGAEMVDLARIGSTHLELAFPPDLPLDEQCRHTLAALGASPTLLVFDNAYSAQTVQPWLPPSGMPCHVLVTSVNEHWPAGWPLLEVRPLTVEASRRLIERLGGAEVAKRFGAELVAMADGLPVQLCPAASALAYEARRGRLSSVRLSVQPEAQQSFRLVYDRLEPRVELLLHAAAFLNTQRIPRAKLQAQLGEAGVADESQFEAALDVCLDLHLLEGALELRMHQLFASFVLATELPSSHAASLQAIRSIQAHHLVELASLVKANPADTASAAALLTFRPDAGDWRRELNSVSAAETVGRALYEIGRFTDAQPWFERAVEEKQRGDVDRRVDHESLGKSLHQVGYCLSSVGRYEEARPWYERAVAEAQQGDVHGRVDHESLGKSLHRVSSCLSSLGRYEEARKSYEQAVEEKRQGDVHGRVDHGSLGHSLHEVGYCLSSLGQYEEALPWYERAMEEKQQGDVHGRVDHASLSVSFHRLGTLFVDLRHGAVALEWFEKAIDASRRGDRFGEVDNWSLATSLRGGASCAQNLGDYERAREWEAEADALDPPSGSSGEPDGA